MLHASTAPHRSPGQTGRQFPAEERPALQVDMPGPAGRSFFAT